MKTRFLEAGRVTGAHGVKGEVKILPWADSADFLAGFEVFYIDEKAVRVIRSRVAKSFLIAAFEGFSGAGDAVRLKNKIIFIDRNDVRLPEGSFFLNDIIGSEVLTEAGENKGRITDVLDLPGGRVYVVKGEREILIPAVPEFIRGTDVEAGTVTVRLIDGM